MLQSLGLQRVRPNVATEQQQRELCGSREFFKPPRKKMTVIAPKWELIPNLQTQHKVTFGSAKKSCCDWAQVVSIAFTQHLSSCLFGVFGNRCWKCLFTEAGSTRRKKGFWGFLCQSKTSGCLRIRISPGPSDAMSVASPFHILCGLTGVVGKEVVMK